MTKVAEKSSFWRVKHNDKALSGIEVLDAKGKLINFIVINHDEILDCAEVKPHRVTIELDENSKPLLPRPQKFDVRIQKQQSKSKKKKKNKSKKIKSNRNPSSVNNADARPSHSHAHIQQSGLQSNLPTQLRSKSKSKSSKSKKSKKSNKTKSQPSLPPLEQQQQQLQQSQLKQERLSPLPQPELQSRLELVHVPLPPLPDTIPSTSGAQSTIIPPNSKKPIVTSIRDLTKQEAIREVVDPKELKLLLKSTPPGGQITLPNGTIFRKSRRGGARAGAGRKRSKPSEGEESNQSHEQGELLVQAAQQNFSPSSLD